MADSAAMPEAPSDSQFALPVAIGRPTLYSEGAANEICDHIAEGNSLASWCRIAGVGYSTVMRWIDAYPIFRDNYARARTASADADADQANDLKRRVIAGEISPDVARFALDSIKWTSARRNPKKYSERQIIAGDPDAPLVVETPEMTLKQRARAMAALLAKKRKDNG